ncbi:NuoM family protein [Janibacter sp. GXQ6167]|uniref:complex I subunit 4 family protein n=1 Tax=Janibacter sp. GXQ6167 TaxID=3240791 RepID=UPI003525404F
MILALAIALPMVVAGFLISPAARGADHRRTAALTIAISVGSLLLSVLAFRESSTLDLPWIPALGIRLHLGIDGISLPLMVLTSAVTALAATTALRRDPTGPDGAGAPTFQACLLLTQAGALATFTARDAVLFFLAFEIVLIPMWVLINRFGGAERQIAGTRFVLYTAFGSTLMLAGILVLVTASGTGDLTRLAASGGAGLATSTQVVIAALLTIGLAVKVPLWPLHSWLPLAHTAAPTAGSMLLAAVLLKMGTYGLIRLPLATVPDGFAVIAPVLAVAGVTGIIWAGLICLIERDLKRLIAWSSVAHMGVVALALATGTATGLQAAIYANLAHGAISALLFFVVGAVKERVPDLDLATSRPALREHAPTLGWMLVFGLAAGLGLPGLAAFWGEFYGIVAALSPAADRPEGLFAVCAVIAAIGAAIAGAYSIRVVRLVWMGDRGEAPLPDADNIERVTGGVLVAAIILLGVAPSLIAWITALPGVAR